MTYTVTVTVAEAPKSSDAGVTSVSVAHTPASKTGETAYTVKLQTNAEVTANSFQIVLSDEKASVSAPTANGDVWTFTVTAEDGTTTAAYTVTVTRRSPTADGYALHAQGKPGGYDNAQLYAASNSGQQCADFSVSNRFWRIRDSVPG